MRDDLSTLKALNFIFPTLVANERAFSTVGHFLTKFRTSLSDKATDALLTLTQYYK